VSLFYISTCGQGVVRFDTPASQLYVGSNAPANTPGFSGGYYGPFQSVTGIVQVYVNAGGFNVQSRDIQATDNPVTFPAGTTPLAVLNLDAVNRIQRITDYTH
jgi:hypothetical protein